MIQGRDRTDTPQTDLGDHAVETCARYAARCRAAQIVVDHVNRLPAQLGEPFAHGILQGAAFPVVLHLVRG
ncbi:hypothetical protein [Gluconacetobacter diazotrophicus]|uniref:hypothetical protein n=1 Tax=Gluconacetobacter diazotrophicus TaxID=33996 RepID=UPI00059D3025